MRLSVAHIKKIVKGLCKAQCQWQLKPELLGWSHADQGFPSHFPTSFSEKTSSDDNYIPVSHTLETTTTLSSAPR